MKLVRESEVGKGRRGCQRRKRVTKKGEVGKGGRGWQRKGWQWRDNSGQK